MIIVSDGVVSPEVPPELLTVDVVVTLADAVSANVGGLTDEFGSTWYLASHPLAQSPGVRVDAADLANDDGSTESRLFFTAWDFELGVVVTGTPESLRRSQGNLLAALGRTAKPMRVVEPTLDRMLMVRRDGGVGWVYASGNYSGQCVATVQVPLSAADPRLYATTVSTFSAPIPGGGQPTVPHEVPHAVSSSTLTRTAINEGTTTAWPKFTLQGPLPEQVSFGNPATGEQMTLRDRQRPGQPLLQAGEWLTLDTHPRVRRVLLFDDPQASRRGWLSGPNVTGDSPWWGFAPGPTTVTVSASSASGVSGDQIACEYRSTWL